VAAVTLDLRLVGNDWARLGKLLVTFPYVPKSSTPPSWATQNEPPEQSVESEADTE
jgi:hypothetical protein